MQKPRPVLALPRKRAICLQPYIMATNADCSAAAPMAISNVVWLEHLTFSDKLACRGVCRTWREVLRHLPLTEKLCIDFDKKLDHVEYVDKKDSTVSIGQAEGEPWTSFKSLCACLSTSANRIHIRGVHSSVWQLQCLLASLQSTSLQRLPEVILETGTSA